MRTEELICGRKYYTDDGYGADLVRVVKGPYYKSDWGFVVVEVEDINTGARHVLGGQEGYAPEFWPAEEGR